MGWRLKSPPRRRYDPRFVDRPTETTPSPWLLWQLIDSAFPVGAFAHSGGLEAAVQLGEVKDATQVRAFVAAAVQSSANLLGPVVVEVVRSPERYVPTDALLDVLLRNPVANKASRSQGQAMLATAQDVWGCQMLGDARAGLRRNEWFGHLPVAFGLVCASLHLDDLSAIDAFLFSQMRSILSAAVRLGVAGSREAQRLQVELSVERPTLLRIALSTPLDRAAQTSPLIELLQAQHDRLYSRLFVS